MKVKNDIKTTGIITSMDGKENILVQLTQVPSQPIIKCYIKGKMNRHRIRVVLGDKVEVEISPDNPALGRIVKRLPPTTNRS